MRKILQRGTAPPIDPRSERRLLERLGFGAEIEQSPLPGDISIRLSSKIETDTLRRAILPGKDAPALDPEVRFDSPDEIRFLALLSKEIGAAATRWVIPQAPLNALAGSKQNDGAGRRVDFLFSAPWLDPFVVEIDGGQHKEARSVDAARDKELSNAGIGVVRIDTSALASGRSVVDPVIQRWRQPQGPEKREHVALLYAPAQLHRLVLAILDGLASGLVAGDRWVLEIEDPLEMAVDLLAPYLDLISAIDRLWDGSVAPSEVVVMDASRSASLVRDGLSYAEPRPAAREDPDLLVRLQPGRSATDSLPPHGDVPQVVVRSAYLPVPVADPWFEGPARADVRAEGEVIEDALRVVLRAVFAKEDFRDGQLDALVEVIEGRDCAVLLPTGAGKSLIYQVAGLATPGRTLVVDPLVSLMDDQVEGLRDQGIDRAVMISAYQVSQGQLDALLEQIASGEALFVFVAPERLQQRDFRLKLRSLTQVVPINLTVVDEAHCVSEWGHDFRTAYLNLGLALRDVSPDTGGRPAPILALTGTASRTVLRDVLIELGIERDSDRAVVQPRTFNRPELSFDIRRAAPDEAKDVLAGIFRGLPSRFSVTTTEFFRPRNERTFSGIVFCPHVNKEHGIVQIADDLGKSLAYEPVIFSGKPPKDWQGNWEADKRRFAASFKQNEAPILVATKAFGMGIDKPNIRYVVHYGIPGSIEGYYQEVGRAGRDAKPAQCTLLLIEYDERRALALLDDSLDIEELREELRSRWESIGRGGADDISRQLYFLLNSFPGISAECAAVTEMVVELGDIGRRRSVKVPMQNPGPHVADKGGREREKERRERALHRLVTLGVVAEYFMEFGPRAFDVELFAVDSDGIADRLLEFVERNQPGRLSVMREQVAPARTMPIEEAARHCARLLVELVYDTIVRSRRRAIREMWLAAREAGDDPNGRFRQRILDYLTQGHVTPVLERLVEKTTFAFEDWTSELEDLSTPEQAPELRGASARLLAAYPDHPGLLLTRGVSDLVDVRGDLRELGASIEAALNHARDRYAASDDDLNGGVVWLLERGCHRPGAATAIVAGLERAGVARAVRDRVIREALQHPNGEPGLRVFGLASILEEVGGAIESVLAREERTRS